MGFPSLKQTYPNPVVNQPKRYPIPFGGRFGPWSQWALTTPLASGSYWVQGPGGPTAQLGPGPIDAQTDLDIFRILQFI